MPKNFAAGILLLLLFFGFQLFFLKADPHHAISTSRGPFTDEGLNTFQARNFVYHEGRVLDEGDNLVKSPLFNVYLTGLLLVLPDSRMALRAALLVSCLLLWMFFGFILKDFSLPTLFLLIAGFQYHIFQFYHFAMVEMLLTSFIIVAMAFAYRYLLGMQNHRPAFRPLLMCFLFLFMAFLLKIQYAYIIGLAMACWIIAFISFYNAYKRTLLGHLLWLIICMVIGAALFYLCWYLPTRDVFEKVWAHQGGDRFSGPDNLWETFINSGKYLLWRDVNLPFALSFLLSLPMGIFLIFKSKPHFKFLLLISACWLLLELHKPFILYLPTRYVLSLFSAQAMWMAITFYAGLIYLKNENRKARPYRYVQFVPLLFIIPLLLGNYQNMKLLWNKKTEESQKIIDYYQHLDLTGKTVAGVWATGLIWNKEAYVIPIWKNFMNDNHLLEKRKPAIVVTEKDELDSEGVFRDRGIDLNEKADSVKTYQYGSYDLKFYFLSY